MQFLAKTVHQSSIAALLLAVSAYSQTISTTAANTSWADPVAVAVDSAGNQYVANLNNHCILKVDRLGAAVVVAGVSNSSGFSGDGGLATSAKLYLPTGVAVDAAGNIYIADSGNRRIRKVGTNGIISTLAGTATSGHTGDGGPSTAAQIGTPLSLTIDYAGSIYFAEDNYYRIRKINASGTISTVAGTGDYRFAGDGGPALLAGINPGGIAVGSDGSIYFTDSGNGYQPRVRRIDPGGTIATIAGTGDRGYSGDGGPASTAIFQSVNGIAVDMAGNVFVSETYGHRIRQITPGGTITTYAGTGRTGYGGDGGVATSALLSYPAGMTIDASSNLYVADDGNSRIRKITPAGGPVPRPTNPAISAFLGQSGFSSNTYLEIYGTSLAQTTRTWNGGDFNGPNAPTTLDGVRVTVNGKAAFVYYVSPSQIDINVPDDTTTGPVQIVVTNALGTSAPITVNRARVSPALQTTPVFNVSGKQYVVAQTPDFKSFIGRPNLVNGVAFTPARPGDTVVIYALGCGPTLPAIQAGTIASQAGLLMLSYQLKIGGLMAQVSFAGAIAGAVGLYQFNVVIPAVPAGDQQIELLVDGVSNSQNLLITVGN